MQDNLFKINETEYILPGSRACQGCGLTLAYRHMLKALRENTVLTIPASCLCVLHGLYPITPVTERKDSLPSWSESAWSALSM